MNDTVPPSGAGAVLASALARGRWALRRVWNMGRRVTRRAAKQARERRAALRGGLRRIRQRAGRVRRVVTRTRKRVLRYHELRVAPALQQRAIEAEIAALSRGSGPVIVGPWLSEVGYEVLYWRPFLQWALRRYGIAPERVVAVSRGGVRDWYHGVAGHYVDLLDLFSPDEFAARNAERQGSGDQKQLVAAEFDEDIARLVHARIGGRPPRLLHPSLMFQMFRRYWFGDRSLDFLLTHTRHEAVRVLSPRLEGLPPRFAAVKLYTGAALSDSPDLRRDLRELVACVAREMPVVILNSGLALDEHEDYLFRDVDNVTHLGDHMTPETNLAIQTRAIAQASLFVGTCGSVAWLAPLLGVPPVAVYADDRFLGPHLYTARHVYQRMGAAAAPFMAVDLTGLGALELLTAEASGGNHPAVFRVEERGL
jgi:hypothetical protein